MKSMISSNNMICRDNLTRTEDTSPQPDVWYEKDDVADSNDPVVVHALTVAFDRWVQEISSDRLKGEPLSLWSCDGERLMISGGTENIHDPEIHQLIAAACRANQPHHSDDAVIVPVAKKLKSGALCALVWTASGNPVSAQLTSELLLCSSLHFKTLFYHEYEKTFVRELIQKHHAIEQQALRQESMLQIGKRLHDQNDVSAVIHEMLNYMESSYPFASFDLYLSQDFVKGDPRIKPLLIRNAAEDLFAQSFLEARPLIDRSSNGIVKLAIPMSGKQAVYGVIGIELPHEEWDESDFGAFILVSSTAGSAFENAKLYEQSNLLITELQMINELTMRLNQSLKLSEIFEFTMSELLRIFKADHCSVLQLDAENDCFQFVASSLSLFRRETVPLNYGFAGMIHKTREPVITSDYWNTRHVSSKIMDATGARSLIASPIMIGPNLAGVIILAHKSPNYFSYDNYKLLQVLSTHIGLAISNASLHAEVRRMVITDNLTGLYARHYLNERIQSKQRKDRFGSLVVVDIDHFKKVNDTHGHLVGDRILILVSEAIRSCIRENDIAARWGGEELAVYLPQIRSQQAYMIAERIRSKVLQTTDPGVTVSCGISEWSFEDDKISVESLFHNADMALYEAKNNGRNCIIVSM